MTRFLFDTNVLLDIATSDPLWLGAKTSPLPDFYIGAHAEAEGLTLVTRDASRYRTCFPSVTVIAPP
jgi:predicted nucleic acid-binding protein